MGRHSSGQPSNSDLDLDWAEMLIVAAMRLDLLANDIAAESSTKTIERKGRDLDAYVTDVVRHLRRMPSDAPSWARELCDDIDIGNRDAVRSVLIAATADLGARMTSRPRALMVLVDIVVFHPWSDDLGWRSRAHRRHLAVVSGLLQSLYPSDLASVQSCFDDLLRQLRRSSVNFGEFTEKVLQVVPEPINDSVVAAATWLAAFWVDDIVVTTIRDDLITELVIIDAENDEEKAKRVVESIQERLAQVVEKQRQLTEELQTYRSAFKLLTVQNRELKRQLLEERERTRLAEVALEVALDRICASPLALTSGWGDRN